MNSLLPPEQARELVEQARSAMAHAIAPVSGFAVGAALLAADGSTATGCNVESRSLLQVVCAERTALLRALTDGRREFTHLAIVAAKQAPVAPCGLCRQMLFEFAPDLMILTETAAGAIDQRPLADYFPFAFNGP
jgi:cytidine deaminase